MRLAVTGRVPAAVRARVLAEHRAELAARGRATVIAHVRDGVHPQRAPYGYRVERTGQELGWTGPIGRAVIAPPYLWVIDPDAADAVAAMVRWCLAGRSDTWIAAHLAIYPNAGRGLPRPIDPRTGRPGVFTPAMVARILSSPVYTGHQTWGRTRRGRPQHPDAWITAPAQSHPALIDPSTFHQIHARRRAHRADRTGPGPDSRAR